MIQESIRLEGKCGKMFLLILIAHWGDGGFFEHASYSSLSRVGHYNLFHLPAGGGGGLSISQLINSSYRVEPKR